MSYKSKFLRYKERSSEACVFGLRASCLVYFVALTGLCLVLGLQVVAFAAPPSPDWQWARKATGAGNSGSGMAVDAEGNIYSTGSFSGTVSFDTITLSSSNIGLFLAKYDSAGNVLWAKTIAQTQGGASNAIVVDVSGNIYLAGSYTNGTTFGSIMLSNQGVYDAFVAKYNNLGTLQWVRRMGGAAMDQATGLTLNNISEIMVTGTFENAANFGNHSLISAGGRDVFVAKYTALGAAVWASRAGGTDHDFSLRICAGPDNSAYICGQFRGAAGFGSHTVNSQGGLDGFVARINAAGGFSWAAPFGGPEEDVALCVRADNAGNAVITGRFFGEAAFETTTLTSAGSYDAFLASYSQNGNLSWAKAIGGVNFETATSLFLDAQNRITLAGSFQNQTTIGNQTLAAVGADDLFVAGFSASGDAVWAKSAGGTANDYSADLVLDNAANCYLSGICFGPSAFGTISLPANGVGSFIARLNSQILSAEPHQNGLDGISLFPNPAQGVVYLAVPASLNRPVTVRVYNITGQLLLTKQFAGQATQMLLPITLVPGHGHYLVQVETGTYSRTFPVKEQ